LDLSEKTLNSECNQAKERQFCNYWRQVALLWRIRHEALCDKEF